MGFFEEVTRILDHLPDDAQQLLFSATVPADIEQIIRKYLTDPETILLSGDEYSVENIHNVMYQAVDSYPKPRNLLYMIETEEPETAIVFCNTRNDTSLVSAVLNRNGYDAELLNGDLPQKERERVMAKVKRGEVRFMVATDIAARGIDISDLSHVINYSLPEDPAVFLHRVGRTGRIGKKGTSVSLVSGGDIHTLSALQKKFGIAFEEKKLPTPEEARRVWTDRHVAELKEAMSASIFEAYIPLTQELKNRQDGDWLVSFALKYFFTHHRIEKMTDLQKAEHKRAEHERRERAERTVLESPRSRRREGEGREAREGGHGGRGGRDRSERERDHGARDGERGRRRSREDGAPVIEVTASSARREVGAATEVPARAAPEVSVSSAGPAGEAGEGGRPARARIFLALGEQDGADEAKVRDAIAALAPGVELLAVELRRSHTFLEVNPDALEGTVSALDGKEWSGKKLAAERARRRRR
jgi:ATP-dependent RNA helicase DeaD